MVKLGLGLPTARILSFILRCTLQHKDEWESSFSVRAATLFNRMPIEVRGSTNLENLKASLGNFLDGVPDCPPMPGYKSGGDNLLVSLLPLLC